MTRREGLGTKCIFVGQVVSRRWLLTLLVLLTFAPAAVLSQAVGEDERDDPFAAEDNPFADYEDEYAGPPKPMRVFVTRTSYRADLKTQGKGKTGAEGADNLCNLAARAVNLGGEWKAWLSTSTEDAADRLITENEGGWALFYNTTPGVNMLADERIAFKNRHAFRTVPLNKLDWNGYDSKIKASYWTGTAIGGMSHSSNCKDWSTLEDTEEGLAGSTEHQDYRWTEASVIKCSERAHLLCVEQ